MTDVNYHSKVARKFLQLQHSASSRGLDFDLSLRSVANILRSKRCYFTKVALNFEEGDPQQLTVDRVDNTKGYVKGNVVACAAFFNRKKGNLTPSDITLLYNRVCNGRY